MSMQAIKQKAVAALSAVEDARGEVLSHRAISVNDAHADETKLALNRMNVARYEMQRACEALGISIEEPGEQTKLEV